MVTGAQFRPPGPITGREHIEALEELIEASGHLTDREKMIAEFWEQGPYSYTPPGIWTKFAIEAIKSEKLSLEDSIKVLFLQANAAFDASIAAWGASLS